MTYIIRKKSKQTPLSGRVVNDLDNPLQQENAPSLELLKKAISAKQLLINNDFQINQRGLSEYVNTINQYTVDMWLGRSNSDISVVANGISLKRNGTYGALVQLLMDDLESKTVTMVVKVNGNIYLQTVKDIANNVNSEKWIVDNVIGFALTKISNKYAIALFNHSSIPAVFEYVDLFEGEIAYPHVKEDYSLSLLRCQRFAREIEINSSGYIAGSAQIKGTINFNIDMNSSPSFTIVNNGTKQNISSVGIVVNTKRIIHTIVSTGAGQFTLDGYKLFISCEPL